MATKSSRAGSRKQPRKSTKSQIAQAKRKISAHDRELKRHAKERAATVRQMDKLLKLDLYHPRKKPRRRDGKPILTKGQTRYIKRRTNALKEFFTSFVPVKPRGSKTGKKFILRAAKKSGLTVKGNAVWVAKSAGGGNLKRARIVTEDKRPVLKEIRTHEKSTIPFATLDELLDQKERLRRQFWRAANKLKKNEHVRFYVEGKYGSNAVFGASKEEFERMYKMLSEYRSTQAQQYSFIASLRMGIQTPGQPRNKVMTTRDVKAEQARFGGQRGGQFDQRGRRR